MSVVSSGTPNNSRSPNHITHIIQNRHRTLNVRTLRVRELCRHDRDTSLVNNQYRNLDAHIGSHIFYEDLYRSNHITTYVVPFVIGMLLARDLIVGISIPSSISLPTSLFTRSVSSFLYEKGSPRGNLARVLVVHLVEGGSSTTGEQTNCDLTCYVK